MSLIVVPTTFELSLDTELLKQTLAYENAALSPNTVRSYKSMCKKFQAWCEANGRQFLPTSAETIRAYLSSIGKSVSFSTLDSTIAAIEMAHEKMGLTIQGDRARYHCIRKGIRRTHKENQTIKQAPVMTVLDLKGVCCRLGKDLRDYRDKALLTTTFFGAFRRSEIVSVDLEHIEFTEKGMAISLLQSKTSDTREIVYVSFAKDKDLCAVKALKEWVEKAEIKEGAVFRSLIKGGKTAGRLSGHAVSEIIKIHFGQEYSGHSARRGLITASAERGTPMHVIKKHSRHKSADMVLRYIDESRGFTDSSVAVLGV